MTRTVSKSQFKPKALAYLREAEESGEALVITDPGRIPSRTRSQIDAAMDAGVLAVSAISAWEVATLVATGRLELAMPVDALVTASEQLPGFRLSPLPARIAASAASLALQHPDPADRFITATAWAANATLVTKDERLRASNLVRTAWD